MVICSYSSHYYTHIQEYSYLEVSVLKVDEPKVNIRIQYAHRHSRCRGRVEIHAPAPDKVMKQCLPVGNNTRSPKSRCCSKEEHSIHHTH